MDKKLIYLFLLVLLCSCAERVYDEDSHSSDSQGNLTFSFDSVTNPAVWSTFNSLEEMQAACQIPESTLKKMTTDQLLSACMHYPLYGNYIAYNNEMDGINAIITHFNGFSELSKRPDAAEKILTLYEKVDVDKVNDNIASRSSQENISFLRLGYLELIIASKNFPSLYEKKYASRLATAVNTNIAKEAMHPEKFCILNIRKPMLVGAQIKLSDKSVSNADIIVLHDFVRSGGNVAKNEIYTKVSQIIAE